jgi:hypothetical protein
MGLFVLDIKVQIAAATSNTAQVCGHRLRLPLDQMGVPKAAVRATARAHPGETLEAMAILFWRTRWLARSGVFCGEISGYSLNAEKSESNGTLMSSLLIGDASMPAWSAANNLAAPTAEKCGPEP